MKSSNNVDTANPELSTVKKALILYLMSSRDLRELYSRILELVKNLGLSDYCFVRHKYANPDIFLVTNPTEQVRTYLKQDLRPHDFALQYEPEDNKPIFLSTLYKVAYEFPYQMDSTIANKKIYELHKAFGYVDYYCIPAKSCENESNVILNLSQRGACLDYIHAKIANYRPSLTVLCEAIDYVTASKFPNFLLYSDRSQSIQLKKKSILVLDTIANTDLNLTEIAKTLCMSISSVNQHLAIMKKTLNCRTTMGAIAEAQKLGLIQYY